MNISQQSMKGDYKMTFTGLHCSNMILTDVEGHSDEEIIRKLCGLALEKGYIEELFIEKILEREKAFPTGLCTEVPIAIPHVHDGCLKSFFTMATLKEPIAFNSMDGSPEKIKVQVVFLFGITDPSQQTMVLRKFCEMFQNGAILKKILDTKDMKQMVILLKENLGDYIVV